MKKLNKFQIQNLKSQTNPNDQNPKLQTRNFLFGICDLIFVIYHD